MDGISRAAGIGPLITLCGERFQVQGRILRHYATIEAEIIKQRGNPLQLVRDCVAGWAGDGDGAALLQDPAVLTRVVSMMFDEAKRWKHVDRTDMARFLNDTWHGTVVATWLAIRHNDPKRLTVDKVGQLVSDEYENRTRKGEDRDAALADAEGMVAEIFAAIDQAGGEDELGNSTGSPNSESSAETTAAS